MLAILSLLTLATIGWPASSPAQVESEAPAAQQESYAPLEPYFPQLTPFPDRSRATSIPLSVLSVTTWTPLGPAPIPAAQTPGNMPSSGRLAALAAHPTNA